MNMGPIRWWLALVMVFAGQARAQSPSAPLPCKSFHLKATISAPVVATVPAEMWFRAPDNFRSVTDMLGHKLVAILAGQDLFSYQEGATFGMKFNRSLLPAQARQSDPTNLLNQAAGWKNRGRKIGSEPVNGRPCDVYEIQEGTDGHAVSGKVWLWTTNGFPLRSHMTVGSVTTEMTVTDIDLDVPVPDAMFQPPAGVQFQDLGALMKNLPNLDQFRKQLGGPQ